MALNEPLEKLRNEAYERYSKLLKEHEKELKDLGASLTARMSPARAQRKCFIRFAFGPQPIV
jgi:hypothetical protein